MPDERLSLREVAEHLNVHITTVARWVTIGVRGHRLASVLIGGRRFVLRIALQDFLAHGNHAEPTRHDTQSDAASKLLDAIWTSPTPSVHRTRISVTTPALADCENNVPAPAARNVKQ